MKMMDKYAVDKKLSTDGVWLDYGDFKVLAARSSKNNPEYRKALIKESRKYQHLINDGTISIETDEEIARKVFAKAVVKDWTLKEDDGSDVPCNYESIIGLFEEYPDFFDDLQVKTGKIETYQVKKQEEEIKN